VAHELSAARAFVQHSVIAEDGDSEGTPNTILEAGCSGVPVIATRHAGITDVVKENETGLLVDEHDLDKMAEAILFLADHPEQAAVLGRNARRHIVENYSLQSMLQKLASAMGIEQT
jgi:glycosyltransferase involved in cell wall biosynthesis